VLKRPPTLPGAARPLGYLLSSGQVSGQKVLDEAGFLVVNYLLANDLRIGRFEVGRREGKVPVCTQQ